jgi:hypothetical protein
MSGRNLKYLAESYLGLDKEMIQRIKKLKTRSCTVVKGYPKLCVAKHDIFTLTDIIDSSDDETSSEEEQYYNKKVIKHKYKK